MSGLERFNQNHGAAGSGHGGQFVSAGSGGGSKAKPMTAHQKHVAHVAHEEHIATHGTAAQRKAALLEQAKADRAKAKRLETELHGLQVREKKAGQAAKAALAHAGRKHATPAQAAAAKHRKTVTHHRHASLKKQITGLQGQIDGLLKQASDLEAQAARLLWTSAARSGWPGRSRTRRAPSACMSTGCTARARRRSAGAIRATSTGASPSSASTSVTRRVTAISRITRRSASTRRRTPRKNTQEGQPWLTTSPTAM